MKCTAQQKQKNPTPAKFIPMIYPQVEREVSCHFREQKHNDTPGNDSAARQNAADTALRRVNLSRTWRDRLLGVGAGATLTLVALWLVLVSAATATVILRA